MENKKFDVLISPTDVLGEELKEVLGGSSTSWCIGGCETHCGDGAECNCKALGQAGATPEDCPPGYVVENGICVEVN